MKQDAKQSFTPAQETIIRRMVSEGWPGSIGGKLFVSTLDARDERIRLEIGRAERWKNEALLAREKHASEVNMRRKDSTARFREWHDALTANNKSEKAYARKNNAEGKEG